MANIVLNTKTYNGSGVINGIAMYTERSAGVAGGFAPLSASVKVGNGSDKTRIHWKAGLPVVAVEATSCACPGQSLRRADADFNIRMDSAMTLAERTDFALRLKDLVASPEFQASIISLQQPAG